MNKDKKVNINIKANKSDGIVIGAMGNNNTITQVVKTEKTKSLLGKILGALGSAFKWFRN